MTVEEQVVSIFAGTNGYLDPLPVSAVRDFETRLLEFVKGQHPKVLADLREKKQIDKDHEATLHSIMKDFGKVFGSGEKKPS